MNIIIIARRLSRPCSTHGNDVILLSYLKTIKDELGVLAEEKKLPNLLKNEYENILNEIAGYEFMSEKERHLKFIGFGNRVESVVEQLINITT